jgi:hypothetical protein
MTEQNSINNENIEIQGLVEGYLRFKGESASQSENAFHPDEDMLNAFVEGNLTSRENSFFVSHLTDCGFCLHKTAELAQLSEVFVEETYTPNVASDQPAKVSEILSGLLSRLFGASDGAVFAHEEKKEDEGDKEKGAEDKVD